MRVCGPVVRVPAHHSFLFSNFSMRWPVSSTRFHDMTRPRSLPSAVFQPHTLRSASQPCARSIPSTAANHSRHLLLKTANAVYVAKSANSGFESSGMHDMVAASVLWRRVGAACAPHTSARRSACAAAAINTHSNIPRQCHVTRSAAVPRVFPRVSVAREGGRGEKACELFTMCCTAALVAKEVGREGSGGGRRKVTRRVRVLHRLMAAHSCAPGEERFPLHLVNQGGRAAVQPAI